MEQTTQHAPTYLVEFLVLFSLLSAGKLLSDFVTDYLRRREENHKFESILAELAEIRGILEAHFEEDYAEEEEYQADNEQEEEQEQEQEQEQEEEEEVENDMPPLEDMPVEEVEDVIELEKEEPVVAEEELEDEGQAAPEHEGSQNDDKHSQLRTHLETGTSVHVSYKKQVFTADFTLKPDAPHGYVFKAATSEFTSPSNFSTHVKKSVNPAVQADNGWDSIYIITGATASGKPVKKSLNDIIKSVI
jgi:chemotaxis protein histidine kinase CheA